MFVNNEIGTVQNIYDIEDIIADTHALFHVDAVQAIGHLDLDFHNFKIDTMSISAHKFGGPKGVGLLLVKEHTPIAYNQLGGEQETKRRAGTENLPQIVGLTKALELAITNQDANNVHLMNLKELFLVQLQERAIPFELNGSMTDSTGHILNIYFPFIDVETMLTLLDLAHVYVSFRFCFVQQVLRHHLMYSQLCLKMKNEQNIQYVLALMNKQHHKKLNI